MVLLSARCAGLPSCILGTRAARRAYPFRPAVTKRIPQPRCELEPGVRAHEAKLLATMLRTSRLTWVFAEPGSDKSALLKNGVMPLLQRRRGDSAQPSGTPASREVTEERRRRPSPPRRELAVYFDAWGDAPLSLLKRRLLTIAPAEAEGDVTFAGLLQHLQQRHGLHFVFLLDRFEDFLAQAPQDAEVGRFADELVEAIARQSSPASFLVAMDEAARPALERFRSRLPGFDNDVLRLSPVSHRPDPDSLPTLVDVYEDTRAAHLHRPPPRVPIKVEDVYAFIASTLARTALPPTQTWADEEVPVAEVQPADADPKAARTLSVSARARSERASKP